MALALPVGLHSGAAEAKPQPAAEAQATASEPDQLQDPALDHAKSLYEEGYARFETFDYEGAVRLWTEAYQEVPEGVDWVRTRLVYNIATAQRHAYDVDHDIAHLRQAVMLLEQYMAQYRAQHEPGPQTDAELNKAQERIDDLQQRIERADVDDPTPAATGERLSSIAWQPPAPADPLMMERNRKLAMEDRKTDRMLVASTVTLSVSGLLTVAGAGAAAGTSDDNAGAQGGSYGTLALGLAGLTTGVTLLAVGLSRRRRAKRGTLVAVTPAVGSRMMGGAVSMRF